jgi:hypothetical protein
MLPNQSSSSCVLATPRERPFNNGGNGPATDLLLCCAQWAQSVVERFITALVIRRAQNNDMRFFYFYTKLDSFSKSKKLYSSHLAYCYLTYTLCMYLDVFPLHKFSYDMSYLYVKKNKCDLLFFGNLVLLLTCWVPHRGSFSLNKNPWRGILYQTCCWLHRWIWLLHFFVFI